MKEFLNPLKDGGYELSYCPRCNDSIEVPSGMNFAWKDGDSVWFTPLVMGYRDAEIIWQRSETEYLMQGKNSEHLMESVGQLKDNINQPNQKTIDAMHEADGISSDKQLKVVEATLSERQSRYGSFVGVANTTGQLMGIIKNSANGQTLPYAHEEALHMICSKIARIVNGDCNHKDSWHDIGGYAKLIENLIEDK